MYIELYKRYTPKTSRVFVGVPQTDWKELNLASHTGSHESNIKWCAFESSIWIYFCRTRIELHVLVLHYLVDDWHPVSTSFPPYIYPYDYCIVIDYEISLGSVDRSYRSCRIQSVGESSPHKQSYIIKVCLKLIIKQITFLNKNDDSCNNLKKGVSSISLLKHFFLQIPNRHICITMKRWTISQYILG